MALDRLADEIRRAPTLMIDAAIGAGVFAVGTIELLSPTVTSRLAQIGLLGMAGLGLLLRRRWLLIAFSLVTLTQVISLLASIPFLGGNAAYLAEMILVYTVAEHRGSPIAALALAAGIALDYLALRQAGVSPASVIQDFPLLVLAWFTGRSQGRRHANAQELEQLADELAEERDRLTHTAVAAERARIVRDLHALVVLGVEEMRLGAKAAQYRLDADAGLASEAIGAIEATGRDTLVQMRRLLSVLRTRSSPRTSSLAGTPGPSLR
jgi:signal transduction histidine kinase